MGKFSPYILNLFNTMILIKEIEFICLRNGDILMMNLVNGACDIIDTDTYNKIKSNDWLNLNTSIIDRLIERNYVFDTNEKYQDFLKNLDIEIETADSKSPPIFLIIPTYGCNLRCVYCYESTYEISILKSALALKTMRDQLNIIDKIVAQNNSYSPEDVQIILMGGEPLLRQNKAKIIDIFKEIQTRGYGLRIVTNGVDLDAFIDDIKKYKIAGIQVTLDGTKETHDQRRIAADGSGSFERIFKNLKLASDAGIRINLRVNLDSSNIGDLSDLANLLIERFGLNSTILPYIYLLQDGGCAGDKNIIDEQSAIEQIAKMEKINPNIKIFDKKYHGSDFINSIFNNTEYQPILRHCGASKNQYILDIKGNVYRCWHGIGNDNYCVGNFDSELKLDSDKDKLWTQRTSNKFSKCRSCKYRYICGAGCPATNTGSDGMFIVDAENCVDYARILKTMILTHEDELIG